MDRKGTTEVPPDSLITDTKIMDDTYTNSLGNNTYVLETITTTIPVSTMYRRVKTLKS